MKTKSCRSQKTRTEKNERHAERRLVDDRPCTLPKKNMGNQTTNCLGRIRSRRVYHRQKLGLCYRNRAKDGTGCDDVSK